MKVILEVAKDDDKNTVAAILFANGYIVRKIKIIVNGKSKYVIEATKDD
jgi:hypothetical protein